MTATKYRLIYAGLTVALIGTVLLAWRFGSPAGEATPVPPPVEAITPGPGDHVLRQASIRIDMPVDYDLELIVDGFRIPESEIAYVPGTGVYSWSPGIDRSFLEWSPGEHDIVIRWNTNIGLPDPGEYAWSFRTS